MNDTYAPVSLIDAFAEADERMVCVFCDSEVTEPVCYSCQEYKGIMTVSEWESYTGESWE